MTYTEILLLAIALSIDACVVSFSYGVKYNHLRFKNSMLLSSVTAIFQALMPIISYFMTGMVKTYVQPYANLIVFLIFSYLGIKFIIEAYEPKREKQVCIDLKCLILIGIATSIDAFSAGISLLLSGNTILKPAILIGLITFINSNIGFFLGGKLKHLNLTYLEVIAGILLIFLGIKAYF